MRSLWVDAGNDADWAKAHAQRMTALYYPLNDPILDIKRRLTDSLAHKYKVGVYAAWNWKGLGFTETDGAGFAEWVNGRLRELVSTGFVMTPSQPKVQLNNERQDPNVIAEMLEYWRSVRPKQDTSWSMEGMQGGWMNAAFVKRVLACKVRLAPQLYNGDMTQIWDSLAITRDLTKRGFPDALVSPFYDAAHLPLYWDGFAFTQGRLP